MCRFQITVVVSIAMLGMSSAVCAVGCSNSSTNDAAESAAKPVASASIAKPVAATTPAAAASNPAPVAATPPIRRVYLMTSVTLGAGRTTLNERPIEQADLQKAFETTWNDYVEACKQNQFVPTFNLQISETEPVEAALQLLTHVGRTKGAKFQLRGSEQFNDAAAATPDRRPIPFQFRPESTGPANTQSELISVTSEVDSKGKLWKTYVYGQPSYPPEQLTESGFSRLREHLALKMNQATLAGHDVPDVS